MSSGAAVVRLPARTGQVFESRPVHVSASWVYSWNSGIDEFIVPQAQRSLWKVESAHPTKNQTRFGAIWNKMNPVVQVSIDDDAVKDSSVSASTMINVTPTHWNSLFDPQWFYQCPGIRFEEDFRVQSRVFTVYHESERNKY
jgi:hypothetical protein